MFENEQDTVVGRQEPSSLVGLVKKKVKDCHFATAQGEWEGREKKGDRGGKVGRVFTVEGTSELGFV